MTTATRPIPEIWFQTTRTGRRTAYRFSYGAGRAIRIGLVDAELLIATGAAALIPHHPITGPQR